MNGETYKVLTDEQLIDELKKGETDALDELYRRYSKKLYAFCFNFTHSEDSEDLVQDVFMRVIEASRRFNPQKASFRTWVFRIARNRCIDLIRREEKIRFISIEQKIGPNDCEEGPALKDVILDEKENVEGSAVNASVIEAVRQCINGLKNQEERDAILLYYMGSKVYKEIGEILGKSTSWAKNKVKSAQEKVKRCLERKGIESYF